MRQEDASKAGTTQNPARENRRETCRELRYKSAVHHEFGVGETPLGLAVGIGLVGSKGSISQSEIRPHTPRRKWPGGC